MKNENLTQTISQNKYVRIISRFNENTLFFFSQKKPLLIKNDSSKNLAEVYCSTVAFLFQLLFSVGDPFLRDNIQVRINDKFLGI